jgi:predicted kinase
MHTTSELVPLLVVREHAATFEPAPTSAAAAPPESRNTLEDSARAPQARSSGPSKPHIHLVIGPVGAGKSTFAFRLARDHGAVRLTLDEWMTRLFSKDRPDQGVMEWYVERAARCIEMIWSFAVDMLERNTNVVLEIGLLTRRERDAFYERVDATAAGLTIHVIDASREVRRRRVEERNRRRGSTFSMVVPPEIFELASDLWELPDATECEGRDVRFIRTDE